jgi:hypothetical protein
MALVRIQREHGVKHIFTAAEGIGNLATIEIIPGTLGQAQVKMGTTGDEHLAAGVAIGAVTSGKLVWAVTQGIISGVKTAQAVNAGDRLAIATSGMVTPFNTITPAGSLGGGGLVSGLQAASGIISGYATLTSGTFTGTAFNTGRVLGKALTSGLSGLGIQMLVSLE